VHRPFAEHNNAPASMPLMLLEVEIFDVVENHFFLVSYRGYLRFRIFIIC
jgi:hypothetical protein